jgi:ABC-type dipeptide/oligopeptide/nickel transport system ATPase subunit
MTQPENRKKFEELIKNWIVMEDSSINSADELIGQSANPFLKAMIEMVKLDSEKHKRILKTLQLSLNSTVTFTTDDLKVIDSFVEKHAMMEKNSVATAEQALEMSSLPIPKMLLEQLLSDEKKHDAYIDELNELKLYMAKGTD